MKSPQHPQYAKNRVSENITSTTGDMDLEACMCPADGLLMDSANQQENITTNHQHKYFWFYKNWLPQHSCKSVSRDSVMAYARFIFESLMVGVLLATLIIVLTIVKQSMHKTHALSDYNTTDDHPQNATVFNRGKRFADMLSLQSPSNICEYVGYTHFNFTSIDAPRDDNGDNQTVLSQPERIQCTEWEVPFSDVVYSVCYNGNVTVADIRKFDNRVPTDSGITLQLSEFKYLHECFLDMLFLMMQQEKLAQAIAYNFTLETNLQLDKNQYPYGGQN